MTLAPRAARPASWRTTRHLSAGQIPSGAQEQPVVKRDTNRGGPLCDSRATRGGQLKALTVPQEYSTEHGTLRAATPRSFSQADSAGSIPVTRSNTRRSVVAWSWPAARLSVEQMSCPVPAVPRTTQMQCPPPALVHAGSPAVVYRFGAFGTGTVSLVSGEGVLEPGSLDHVRSDLRNGPQASGLKAPGDPGRPTGLRITALSHDPTHLCLDRQPRLRAPGKRLRRIANRCPP